ncbi:uncharacterized protein LOC116528401 [Sapajus apella]|uniref:Uncharacterized protein LOC116528401 n=1 Tax=Sapajus apella TaxID=9515 RepID=A0A6J3F7H5_SAPAP|nr:uncharacterized protein LOC116528401 [Sapajus apella]
MGAEPAGTETEMQMPTQPAQPRTARGENPLLAPSLGCRWAQEAGTTLTKAESFVGDFLPRTVTLSPCNRFPLKTLRKGLALCCPFRLARDWTKPGAATEWSSGAPASAHPLPARRPSALGPRHQFLGRKARGQRALLSVSGNKCFPLSHGGFPSGTERKGAWATPRLPPDHWPGAPAGRRPNAGLGLLPRFRARGELQLAHHCQPCALPQSACRRRRSAHLLFLVTPAPISFLEGRFSPSQPVPRLLLALFPPPPPQPHPFPSNRRP